MANFSIPLPDQATFLRSNPWIEAVRNMQQIRAAAQQEAQNKLKLQYLPQELEAQQKEQALRQQFLAPMLESQLTAQLAKQKQMQNLAENPSLAYAGKGYKLVDTPQGLMRVNVITGQAEPFMYKGSPLRKQLSASQIQPLPGGGYIILPGQSAQPIIPPTEQDALSAAQQGVSLENSSLQPKDGALMPTLGSAATRYGVGGRTFYDPIHKGVISSPTTSTMSSIQQQQMAISRLQPELMQYATKVSKVLPSSPGLAGLAKKGSYELMNLFGAPPENYTEARAAMKQEAPVMVESFIKAKNLPKTNESVSQILDVLRPSNYESREQFLRGVTALLAQLEQQRLENEQTMKGGIAFGGKVDPDNFKKIESDIYANLSSGSMPDALKNGDKILVVAPNGQVFKAPKGYLKNHPEFRLYEGQ